MSFNWKHKWTYTNETQIGDFSINNSGSEKLLGVNINGKLTFDCHVNHLCNKANNKLSTPCMTLEKKTIGMN